MQLDPASMQYQSHGILPWSSSRIWLVPDTMQRNTIIVTSHIAARPFAAPLLTKLIHMRLSNMQFPNAKFSRFDGEQYSSSSATIFQLLYFFLLTSCRAGLRTIRSEQPPGYNGLLMYHRQPQRRHTMNFHRCSHTTLSVRLSASLWLQSF